MTERPNAIIAHEPGAETQWDWLDLLDPPASWEWGRTAHLLVGSLAHSAKWRGGCRRARTSHIWWKAWIGSPGPWAGDAVVAV